MTEKMTIPLSRKTAKAVLYVLRQRPLGTLQGYDEQSNMLRDLESMFHVLIQRGATQHTFSASECRLLDKACTTAMRRERFKLTKEMRHHLQHLIPLLRAGDPFRERVRYSPKNPRLFLKLSPREAEELNLVIKHWWHNNPEKTAVHDEQGIDVREFNRQLSHLARETDNVYQTVGISLSEAQTLHGMLLQILSSSGYDKKDRNRTQHTFRLLSEQLAPYAKTFLVPNDRLDAITNSLKTLATLGVDDNHKITLNWLESQLAGYTAPVSWRPTTEPSTKNTAQED